MAIDSLPPWLNVSPRDFVAAGSAGAAAGESAARTALEAQSLSQRAAEEGARLSQAERLHAMDIQARQDIAEQNRLREDQQLAVENAYKTAQIGLGKQKIEEARFLAETKARDAARQFADEQGFSQAIAGGASVPEAMSKFPRTRSAVAGVMSRATVKKGEAKPKFFSEFPGVGFIEEPSGQVTIVNRAEKGMTPGNAISLEKALAALEEQKKLSDPKTKIGKSELDKIDEHIQNLEGIRSGKLKPSATPTTKQFRYDPTSGELKPVDLSTEPSHDEGP